MVIQYINSNQIVSFQDFPADALNLVQKSGVLPLVVLNNNKPVFYVLPPEGWDLICTGHSSLTSRTVQSTRPEELNQSTDTEARLIGRKMADDQKSFEKQNKFTRLADELLDAEWERVSRKELSSASVGIQKNRLEAHVLPFFRYIVVPAKPLQPA